MTEPIDGYYWATVNVYAAMPPEVIRLYAGVEGKVYLNTVGDDHTDEVHLGDQKVYNWDGSILLYRLLGKIPEPSLPCDCPTCHGEGLVGLDGETCACIRAGCKKAHGRDAYLLPPEKR